jgi:hypothetical protein
MHLFIPAGSRLHSRPASACASLHPSVCARVCPHWCTLITLAAIHLLVGAHSRMHTYGRSEPLCVLLSVMELVCMWALVPICLCLYTLTWPHSFPPTYLCSRVRLLYLPGSVCRPPPSLMGASNRSLDQCSWPREATVVVMMRVTLWPREATVVVVMRTMWGRGLTGTVAWPVGVS